MKWRFTPKSPGERTRDPISSEFFASDAIKNAGEALIREAVQNSLDARIDQENGKVRIRVYVSGEKGALSPQAHSRWFRTAWPHYGAENNGLNPGKIMPVTDCRFLVFEDFDTKGLIGDRMQFDRKLGVENLFFYFFRAEGATEKEADRLGRWGIGKQVFPRSSLAQTIFGYSETSEGGRNAGFLMGSCILKHHAVDGVVYRPDGYFSESVIVKDCDELPVPSEDLNLIDQFRKDFRISRDAGQTGLSVVVPWLDDGPEETIQSFDRDTLILAIIEGYFFPILEGKLEAAVEDEDMNVKIAADNLIAILDSIEVRADEDRKKDVSRVRAYIRLAQHAHQGELASFVLPPCPEMKAMWTEDMLGDELALQIREELSSGRPVEIRSSLTIRPKGGTATTDSFSCFLLKEDGANQRPCHIREELIISDVACTKINGFVCLIRINRGPMANLLGDSENPAHTEWQSSSRNFKDNYVYGGMVIGFVSSFGTEIIRRVYASSRRLDRGLLMDYFSDPGPEIPDDRIPKRKQDPGTDQVDTVPPIPLARTTLSITALKSGFTVSPVGADMPAGSTIDVRAAYETTKGNAFNAYKPYDFAFDKSGIQFRNEGCEVIEAEENCLSVRTTQSEFSISVTGFDINRDVVVRAVRRKVSDLDTEEAATQRIQD